MRYARNPAVNETEVDGEYFLVTPENGEIYYLDILSSALWRLIETPQESSDVMALLKDAFPETKPETIEADVSKVLDDMSNNNLIHKEQTA